MSLLDRIRTCQAWQPEAYRPFMIGRMPVGRVRHGLARRLADFPDVFQVSEPAVSLVPALADFDSRTAAVDGVVRALVDAGDIALYRAEAYPVVPLWGDPPLLKIDRGSVPDFGVRGYGVHLNGLVEGGDGLMMWVAKRSMSKPTGPGKLDHLAAGGQPYGLGVRENLIKESAEEADLPAELAARAVAVSAVSYRCERPEGLRDDVLFSFDLTLPPDFQPRNTDGEVEWFQLWPIADVAARIRDSDDFKFNVALVIIDFLIRRGLVTPDDPDYMALVDGLHLAE